MKGKLIFLNGVTSTGKSTVADCIKEMSCDIFYASSNDIFHDMAPWNHFEDKFWAFVAHSITAQYHAVRGLIDGGFNVIIDGMFLDLPEYRELFGKSNYELFCELFMGYEYMIADLICAPSELRRRNIVRRNRDEFQSDEQLSKMTDSLKTDLTVDVMKILPEECASMILEKACIPYQKMPAEKLVHRRCRILSELLQDFDASVSCANPDDTSCICDADVIGNVITVKSFGEIDPIVSDLMRRGYSLNPRQYDGFPVLERRYNGQLTEILYIQTTDGHLT